MFFYKLDYAIGKVFTTEPRRERILIKKFTGKKLSERDAILLWEKIADHKWFLSETLKRDVGFRMAAVDYVENFYQPEPAFDISENISSIWDAISGKAVPAVKKYFEAKSKTISN